MIFNKNNSLLLTIGICFLTPLGVFLIWGIFFIKANVLFTFSGLVQDYVSEHEVLAPIDGVVSFSGISESRIVNRFEHLLSISTAPELAREDELKLSYDNINLRLQCLEALQDVSSSYSLTIEKTVLENLERSWEGLPLAIGSFCKSLMSEFRVAADQFRAFDRNLSIMSDRLAALEERLFLEERNAELVRQAWLNLQQLANRGSVSTSEVDQIELELNGVLARIGTVRTNILELDSEIVSAQTSRDLLVIRWRAQIDATRAELASARDDLEQQLNIQTARNSLGDVFAPLSGYLVVEDAIFSGQTVLRGQKLAVLRESLDSWVVVSEVPLDRFVSIDVGSRINIQWNSGISETLRSATGHVVFTEINPSGREGGIPTVASIIVEIDEQELAELPSNYLRNGVSVQLSVAQLSQLWHMLR